MNTFGNSFNAQVQAIEDLATRALLFELAISVIVVIIGFWLTYLVIKLGVRDGIREAGGGKRTHERPLAPPGYKWALVKETASTEDMRAD